MLLLEDVDFIARSSSSRRFALLIRFDFLFFCV